MPRWARRLHGERIPNTNIVERRTSCCSGRALPALRHGAVPLRRRNTSDVGPARERIVPKAQRDDPRRICTVRAAVARRPRSDRRAVRVVRRCRQDWSWNRPGRPSVRAFGGMQTRPPERAPYLRLDDRPPQFPREKTGLRHRSVLQRRRCPVLPQLSRSWCSRAWRNPAATPSHCCTHGG